MFVVGCSSFQDIDPFAEKPTKSIQEMINDSNPAITSRTLQSPSRPVDRSRPIAGTPDSGGRGLIAESQFKGNLSGQGSGTILSGMPQNQFQDQSMIDPADLKKFEVRFENTSLRDIVKFVFDQYLDAPYSILNTFEDRQVNWVASGRFTQEQVLRLLITFLEAQDVYVRSEGGTYLIDSRIQPGGLRSTSAGGANANPGALPEIGQSTGMWQLKYLNASELTPILQQFIPDNRRVGIMNGLNVIVLTSQPSQIEQVDTFIRRVDIVDLKGKSILIYAPRHLSAEALTGLIQSLPDKLGFRKSANNPSIEAEIIEGTQQVFIMAGSRDMKDFVKQFIFNTDQPGKDERQIFFYPVRNQDAQEVQDTITSLMPELTGSTIDPVRVVTHASTNSLLVHATPTQYYDIRKVIDRLDFDVSSVMIDATIVEVQLEDQLSYGVQWFLNNFEFGDYEFGAGFNLNNINSTDAAASLELLSLSSVDPVATLNFLRSHADLRVLSRPRVMVRNQATATIKSTDEVRVISSRLATDIQNPDETTIPQNEFETEEFGVTLVVTPNIADDGTITMVVEIEDSRRGADQNIAGIDQPTFNIREVTTELVIKDTETVMIGGLIQEDNNTSESKVPFFGDIPMLGNAFSNTSQNSSRTELVVFLTPYIVTDSYSARLVTEAFSGLTVSSGRPMIAGNIPTSPSADLRVLSDIDRELQNAYRSLLRSPELREESRREIRRDVRQRSPQRQMSQEIWRPTSQREPQGEPRRKSIQSPVQRDSYRADQPAAVRLPQSRTPVATPATVPAASPVVPFTPDVSSTHTAQKAAHTTHRAASRTQPEPLADQKKHLQNDRQDQRNVLDHSDPVYIKR